MSSLYDQMSESTKASYCNNPDIYVNLTDLGLRKVTQYIEMLNKMKKRIEKKKMDTFYITTLPDVEDIVNDIFWRTKLDEEYYGMWHVSDNIFAERFLKLSIGRDYFLTKLGEENREALAIGSKSLPEKVKDIVDNKYRVANEETVISDLKDNPSHYITISDSNKYIDIEIKRSGDNLGYIIDVWRKDDLVKTMTIWDDDIA